MIFIDYHKRQTLSSNIEKATNRYITTGNIELTTFECIVNCNGKYE